MQMTAAPKVGETEVLQCVAGPLCGRRVKIRKSARGMSLNASMIARFKRESGKLGIPYRHGAYMKEIWRKGKLVLLWTEMPASGPFNVAKG